MYWDEYEVEEFSDRPESCKEDDEWIPVKSRKRNHREKIDVKERVDISDHNPFALLAV